MSITPAEHGSVSEDKSIKTVMSDEAAIAANINVLVAQRDSTARTLRTRAQGVIHALSEMDEAWVKNQRSAEPDLSAVADRVQACVYQVSHCLGQILVGDAKGDPTSEAKQTMLRLMQEVHAPLTAVGDAIGQVAETVAPSSPLVPQSEIWFTETARMSTAIPRSGQDIVMVFRSETPQQARDISTDLIKLLQVVDTLLILLSQVQQIGRSAAPQPQA